MQELHGTLSILLWCSEPAESVLIMWGTSQCVLVSLCVLEVFVGVLRGCCTRRRAVVL
jgi:hypothetical protein